MQRIFLFSAIDESNQMQYIKNISRDKLVSAVRKPPVRGLKAPTAEIHYRPPCWAILPDMEMDMINDETTGRFYVIEVDGRYMVRERETNRPVRFSFDRKAIPFADYETAARWGNFYSARGFAQKLSRLHP